MSTNGKPVGRVLPLEEWAEKLKGTSLEGMPLDPQYSTVVVVEAAGAVIACGAAFTTVHVEGLWKAETPPDHEAAERALLDTLLTLLRTSGVGEVLTTAATPAAEQALAVLGAQRIPGTQWVLTIPSEVP